MPAAALTDKDYTSQFVNSVASTSTLHMLSQVNARQACRALIFDWTLCVCAIGLAQWSDLILLKIIAIVVIGAQQHALLILAHESVHYRLTRSKKMNDLISNLFAAYPIFFCTQGYRINHLAHHRELNSLDDPDWARKTPLWEWQFPKSRSDLVKMMGLVLLTSWYKMIHLFCQLSILNYRAAATSITQRNWLITKLGYYGCLLTCLYLTSGWGFFALYWLVPYFLVMPVLERVRSISEHFALSYADDFNQTRNVLSSGLEAFFFGPHNIRYHLDHHLFPTVPQYNLPQLHAYLMTFPDYARSAHQNNSYLFGRQSVLQDILTKKGENHAQSKIHRSDHGA